MIKLKEHLNFWLSVPWNLRLSALGSLVTCALMLISLGVSIGSGLKLFFGSGLDADRTITFTAWICAVASYFSCRYLIKRTIRLLKQLPRENKN